MGKLFGTDGFRGTVGVEPMTAEMASMLGKAMAHVLADGNHKARFVVGRDTRYSGEMLEEALSSGIRSTGADVLLVGILPTPGVSVITRELDADAGVVITASHNPSYENGFKFFDKDGFKLPEGIEDKIEEILFSKDVDSLNKLGTEVGKASRLEDAASWYTAFLKNALPPHCNLGRFKVILDCANGAAYQVAPLVLQELGVDLIAVGIEPDGRNINQDWGALPPELVSSLVRKEGADLGIALDGDGDRIVFVDHRGQYVGGDHVMGICALDMMKEGRLKRNTLWWPQL